MPSCLSVLRLSAAFSGVVLMQHLSEHLDWHTKHTSLGTFLLAIHSCWGTEEAQRTKVFTRYMSVQPRRWQSFVCGSHDEWEMCTFLVRRRCSHTGIISFQLSLTLDIYCNVLIHPGTLGWRWVVKTTIYNNVTKMLRCSALESWCISLFIYIYGSRVSQYALARTRNCWISALLPCVTVK